MLRPTVVILAMSVLAGNGLAGQRSHVASTSPTKEVVVAQADVKPDDQRRLSSPVQQEKNSPVPAAGQSIGWFTAIAVLLSLALIVSVCISFYLYRWRRILLSSPHLLVPEELGERLTAHEKAMRKIENAIATGTGRLAERSDHMSGQVSNLVDTFMTLQNTIDEKEQEIRRFKSGYDIQIFRRYLYRFVRIHQAISDYEREGGLGEQEMSKIRRLLEDALDECGVEPFEPEVGGDYREADGVADNPKYIPTENAAENFKIAEVSEQGYRIRAEGESFDTIVPARVRIFIHRADGGTNGDIHRN